jgi:hypothetical protein
MNNFANSGSANRYGSNTQSGGGTSGGNIIGNVTGNVTGKILTSNGITTLDNETGILKGGVTGNVTGILTGSVVGKILSSSGYLILDNGSDGSDAVLTGGVTGNVIGDVTGKIFGNNGQVILDNDNGSNGSNTVLHGNVIGDVKGKIFGTNGQVILDNDNDNGSNGSNAVLRGNWIYDAIIDANVNQGDTRIANCKYVNDKMNIFTEGLHVLKACKYATTVSITYPFIGLLVIDGKTTHDGDRVLVKNQTDNIDNGIWVVRDHPHVWEREKDFNTGTAQIGDFVFITNGLTNNAHGFVCTSFSFDSPLTSVWETFSGAGENAVTLTGDTTYDICTVTGAHNIKGEDKLTFNGTTLTVLSTTESTSIGIGCAVFKGGVGIATDLHVGSDITAYSSSDKRLKNNIKNIENPLEKLSKIGGYTFDWIPKEGVHNNKGSDIGIIAQEVEEFLPEIVVTRDNGYKAVRYEKLVALLIESNKELLKRVEVLESKIEELTN